MLLPKGLAYTTSFVDSMMSKAVQNRALMYALIFAGTAHRRAFAGPDQRLSAKDIWLGKMTLKLLHEQVSGPSSVVSASHIWALAVVTHFADFATARRGPSPKRSPLQELQNLNVIALTLPNKKLYPCAMRLFEHAGGMDVLAEEGVGASVS
jgi:hypothetical protein